MKNSSTQTKSTIALVAPAVAREGITKQIANQINGFCLRNFNVYLILLAESDINVLEEFGVDVQQLTVLQLRQPDPYLSWKALKGSAGLISPIFDFLRFHKVDVVVAHAPYAHFVMRLVKLKSKFSGLVFKLIQYFHGLQYSEYPLNTWKRQSVNTLNRLLAKRCDDAHISVSDAVKQEIEENLIGHSNHTVISNCLSYHDNWNESAEQAWQHLQPLLQEAAGKYIILLPNRVDYNKGQLFFINVIQAFLQSRIASATDLAVFIVGEGPQKKEVEQVVQAKDLGSVVKMTGALPNAVVRRLMEHAHLVVIPSYKEGFSFVALEALAVNCPVLATDTGALKEMLQDSRESVVFKTRDVADCLKKLKELYLSQDKSHHGRGTSGNDVQEKFSLENHMRKLLHIIQTI